MNDSNQSYVMCRNCGHARVIDGTKPEATWYTCRWVDSNTDVPFWLLEKFNEYAGRDMRGSLNGNSLRKCAAFIHRERIHELTE